MAAVKMSLNIVNNAAVVCNSDKVVIRDAKQAMSEYKTEDRFCQQIIDRLQVAALCLVVSCYVSMPTSHHRQ